MIESEFIATVLASKYFSIIQMYVYCVGTWGYGSRYVLSRAVLSITDVSLLHT